MFPTIIHSLILWSFLLYLRSPESQVATYSQNPSWTSSSPNSRIQQSTSAFRIISQAQSPWSRYQSSYIHWFGEISLSEFRGWWESYRLSISSSSTPPNAVTLSLPRNAGEYSPSPCSGSCSICSLWWW